MNCLKKTPGPLRRLRKEDSSGPDMSLSEAQVSYHSISAGWTRIRWQRAGWVDPTHEQT